MPKRSKDAYDSDGGFVEDVPSGKKSRKANDVKKREGKKEVDLSKQKDDNGDAYWELSATRRVTVSNFKGKQMINIREYYLAGDKYMPGKKGISLPIDQYTALLAVLPDIEDHLAASGVDVPRPEYSKAVSRTKSEIDEGDDEEGEDADPPPPKRHKKSNIEETSDEDDD